MHHGTEEKGEADLKKLFYCDDLFRERQAVEITPLARNALMKGVSLYPFKMTMKKISYMVTSIHRLEGFE